MRALQVSTHSPDITMSTMETYQDTFDWVALAQGRARFSGIQRGWDEHGRVTFCVEVAGNPLFGEIDQAFLDNSNDFDLEVVSFGYGRAEDVGMPRGQVPVVPDALATVESLVIGLVRAAREFQSPPNILAESPTSSFMGRVFFREGWALVAVDQPLLVQQQAPVIVERTIPPQA